MAQEDGDTSLYAVRHKEEGQALVMLAPLTTIQAVYRLHQAAIDRIKRASPEESVVLHDTKPNGTITVVYACQEWQALAKVR